MREKVMQRTEQDKLIAIVRGMEERLILPLCEALHKGGIRMIEVTFNQAKPESFSSTAAAIRSIVDTFKGEVYAGAGTVITPEQLKLAADAGAMYIISPNTDPEIIRGTRELGLVSMPGAMTPSECMVAHNAGADYVKLFPLGNLGPGYLKALKAPLSHLKFLGVGGINDQNIPEYLAAGAKGFGVGGNLVNKEWIESGQFDKITELAKRYVEVVRQ
ncbi:MAG: bifunctional 4-hydroxy-2-oxoglutarate aldolase/2-dehydro-3-deoxy-phosphogluconate aldolase [Oscillospiraceae bacterium]